MMLMKTPMVPVSHHPLTHALPAQHNTKHKLALDGYLLLLLYVPPPLAPGQVLLLGLLRLHRCVFERLFSKLFCLQDELCCWVSTLASSHPAWAHADDTCCCAQSCCNVLLLLC